MVPAATRQHQGLTIPVQHAYLPRSTHYNLPNDRDRRYGCTLGALDCTHRRAAKQFVVLATRQRQTLPCLRELLAHAWVDRDAVGKQPCRNPAGAAQLSEV